MTVSDPAAKIECMFESTVQSGVPDLLATTTYPATVTWSAGQVAEEIRRRQPSVPRLKLHKLLYYCQGHHAAHTGGPLFRERVSAWDHGPVVGALWYEDSHSAAVDPVAGDSPLDEPLDESALNTIGYVLSRYGRLSGRDLEVLTHHEPPWVEANARREAGGSEPIGIDSLAAFFREADQAGGDSDEVAPDSSVVRAFLERSTLGPPGTGTPDSREALERLKTGA